MSTESEKSIESTSSERSGRPLSPQEADLINWFTYHAPSDLQISQMALIRHAALHLAQTILLNSQPGPDQTAAIRKVREAVMTVNQGIVCSSPALIAPALTKPAPPSLPPESYHHNKD